MLKESGGEYWILGILEETVKSACSAQEDHIWTMLVR
jgi:hypothetical protein